MCGIVGFNWDDKGLLKKMADAIRHRGPDDSGYFTDGRVSLGHRRLSIIDLSRNGRNPIWNENRDICVVFNGEIFNYVEIREELEKKGHRFTSNTDTEVIVHSYEEYGEACVGRFIGFFAFALYDIPGKKLFLARDRIGKKPLYYYMKGGRFVFASEIKAITEHAHVKREIDAGALNNFLCLRYNPSERTALRGILRLKPGTTLAYHLATHRAELKRYWQIDNRNAGIVDRPLKKTESDILELLEDSVKKRMISDVPLGAYLSGGIDSSSIVAIMAKLNPGEKIKTFSVGFDGDQIGNELGYAKEVSKIFGTEHREILIKSRHCMKELPKIVWHLDEPMSDPAVVPNYIMSREAKKKVTVVLTGDGADELFAGYDQYRFLALGNRLRWLPKFVRRDVSGMAARMLPYSLLNRIYPYSSSTGREMFQRFSNFFSEIDDDKAKAYLEVVSIFNEEERERLLLYRKNLKSIGISGELNRRYFRNRNHFLNNLIRLDMENYLPEDLLMKPDKMCMASHIEARVPFLDHRLIEYAFTIEPGMKLRGTTTKYVMKRAVSRLLPKSIVYRKKQPFVVPLDVWIEKDLKATFRGMIDKGSIIREGIIDKEYVRKIFSNYSSSRMYYGRQLWSLVNLELWHNIFIEGISPEKLKI